MSMGKGLFQQKDKCPSSPKYSIFLWNPIQKLILLKVKLSFCYFLIHFTRYESGVLSTQTTELSKENSQHDGGSGTNERQDMHNPGGKHEQDEILSSVKVEQDTNMEAEAQITPDEGAWETKHSTFQSVTTMIQKCNTLLRELIPYIIFEHHIEGGWKNTHLVASQYVAFFRTYDPVYFNFLQRQIQMNWESALQEELGLLFQTGLYYYFLQCIYTQFDEGSHESMSSLDSSIKRESEGIDSNVLSLKTPSLPKSTNQPILLSNLLDNLDFDSTFIWKMILETQPASLVDSCHALTWKQFQKINQFKMYLYLQEMTRVEKLVDTENNLEEHRMPTDFGRYCHKSWFFSKYLESINEANNYNSHNIENSLQDEIDYTNIDFVFANISNPGDKPLIGQKEVKVPPPDAEIVSDLQKLLISTTSSFQFISQIEALLLSYHKIDRIDSQSTRSNLPLIIERLLQLSYKVAHEIEALQNDAIKPYLLSSITSTTKDVQMLEVMVNTIGKMDINYFLNVMLHSEK